jgi:hypothetical protein
MAAVACSAWAFDSGSTGADGAFNPLVNTELQLPPSGVFNFTTVTIPAGITVTFKRNAANTPVVILASGDVTVAGAINLSGAAGKDTGTAGDGVLGDDGQPGLGGAGGYDGGRGGTVGGSTRGGNGLGPGGGGGNDQLAGSSGVGGGGGGFAGGGGGAGNASGGAAYGSATLLPLVGGSGGGGGRAGTAFNGAGGGGGGGAILIASSGTVNVTGSITASGGPGGGTGGPTCGGPGGGGSGGAIRILATRLAGNGNITATGAGYVTTCNNGAGNGSVGRIRLEAEIMNRTAGTNPTYSFSSVPGPVFVAGLPTLRIARIGGFDVPAVPTSEVDVSLPADFPNPVTVEFATTGVPVGNTVSLRVVPAQGDPVNATSSALTGNTEAATASVAIDIPTGPTVLQASTTYNIVVAQGEALSRYAQGERVDKIRLEAALGDVPVVTLITVSGKEYTLPAPPQSGAGG